MKSDWIWRCLILLIGVAVGVAVKSVPAKQTASATPPRSGPSRPERIFRMSDQEVVYLDRLALAHDDDQATRYMIRAVESPDSNTLTAGEPFLEMLAYRKNSGIHIARGLLEDVLLRNPKFSWQVKCIALLGFVSLGKELEPSGPHPQATQLAEQRKSEERGLRLADECSRARHLSREAKDFCQTVLGQSNSVVKRTAIPVLVAAAQVSDNGREWAIKACRAQVESTAVDRSTWVAVYEAMTGEFQPGPPLPTATPNRGGRPVRPSP